MKYRKNYLHNKFREIGARAKKYTRQCMGMLPEIYKLRVFEEKGFGSIYEYAAKLAGISKAQVDTVLRLEKRFENKPDLRQALVTGEVSHHKLARVASIATKENEKELVEKVKLLPKSALDVFVKDVRKHDGSSKPQIEQKCLPGQTLELAEDVEKELSDLQAKGIDVNAFLRECLEKRKFEIVRGKKELSKEAMPAKSRYISVKIRNVLQKEYGKKCSIPGCEKPSKTIHHTQRFGMSQTHDPLYLAPVCQEHHIIAHTIDTKYHMSRRL